MTTKNKEIELKYSAAYIQLSEFRTLAKKLKPVGKLDISSWDMYYTNGNKDEFIRFRDSDEPELTIKRKTREDNNWHRVEIDLPLDITRLTPKLVKDWVGLLNYKENFRIYKKCFIFWYKYVNMVYYIVYDDNMKEKNRFLEIEINKDKVKGLGISKCFKELEKLEKELAVLGINSDHRLKQSLYEMYRR